MNSIQTPPALPPKVLDELKAIVGDKHVLTQPGDLYVYSYDAALDRSLPSAVVLPGTPDEVAQVVRALAKIKKSYVARGAATGLAGGAVPMQGAVVIALTRMTSIGRIDPARHEIPVEPGVVNLKLQQTVEPSGFFFAPDPGSQKACTIGGNIGMNAGGPHCLKYGVTSSHVMAIEVVLPDGQVSQFRVDDPGYDLTGFFVGTEGTLGIVTRARLKLLPKPKAVRTMLVSFNSIEEAIQSVTDIIADGLLPATLEAMDRTVIEAVEAFSHAGYPAAEAVLLIEVDGDQLEELDRQADRIKELCEKNHSQEFRVAKSEAERTKLWEGRRGSYAAMARLAPNVLVEDGAVPRTKLPEALRQIKQIAEAAKLRVALLFHAGDGNLHPQIIFDERDAAHTKIVKDAGYKMLKACVDLGGTISGEHGIGIDKREAMRWLFTRETLGLFRRIKNAFDADNLCNPDKLIPLVGKSAAAAVPAAPLEIKAGVDGSVVPANEAELVAIVAELARVKKLFSVNGLETKFRVKEDLVLRTTSLNKILEIDAANLTVTAQAGVPIDQLRAEVEKQGRHVWISGKGTVGGTVASRSSVQPPLRDLILAMRILLPTGEVVSVGAKTMKNVAGYDVAKLLIGSWGTLAIILDVTFRLYAFPAKAEKAEVVHPFVLKDIHRRIKKAFDPAGLISPRTCSFTDIDIASLPKDVADPFRGGQVKSLEDRFWM